MRLGIPLAKNGYTRLGNWVDPRDTEGRPNFYPIKTLFPKSADQLTLCLVTACQSARERGQPWLTEADL